MKMKIAALVLIVLLPVLAVTATYATKPPMGSGTVTTVSRTPVGSAQTVRDNTIATFKVIFSITGTLTGRAAALERDVTHASGDKSFTTFQGDANFNATTGEAQSGTAIVHYVGIANSTFVHGQFVIGSGTGSMANFHGQGEFSGPAGPTLKYTIKWHISPVEVKTKTAA